MDAEGEKVVVILTTFALEASFDGVKAIVRPEMGDVKAVSEDG